MSIIKKIKKNMNTYNSNSEELVSELKPLVYIINGFIIMTIIIVVIYCIVF
jgi:hypothetical protein